MSVSSAAVGRPLPRATSTIARASSRAPLHVGEKRPGPDLDVHDQRVQAGGELLGEDRADDQRDRLHRPGGVADRVQPAVGRGQARGLADDRAAHPRAPRPQAVDRSRERRRSRGSPRACPACRRCGRARGRRSSARPRRRRPRSAPAAGSPCRPRRRSSACRAPVRTARRPPSPARRPSASSPRSARRAPPRSCRVRKIAMASAPTWASVTAPSAIPATSCCDLLRPTAPRRRAFAGSAQRPASRAPIRSRKPSSRRLRSTAARSPSRSVCSWLSGTSDIPSARLVIAETATHPQPAVARHGRLVHGGHADGVGAQDR